MSSLLARIGAWFVEPPQPTADTPRPPTRFLPPSAARADPASPEAAAASPSGRAATPPPATTTVPFSRGMPAESTRSAAPSVATGDSARPTPSAVTRDPARAAPQYMPPSSGAPGVPAPSETTAAADASTSARVIGSAAVLGAPAVAVPLAAACAGELRARAKAAAAVLCLWRPGPRMHAAVSAESAAPAAESPAGATTPGARRLAARLTAHDLIATACGRLAWLPLEPEPAAAADQVRRCLAIAGAPVVLAVAGARPPAFEPLIAGVDLAVAVLPSDIEPALRDLALVTLRAPARAVLPPLPPGPPRWAAMAGLARLRSLPRGES